MADSQARQTQAHPLGDVSKWKVAIAVMVIGIAGFVGFLLIKLILPANWEFSVEAATEIADIELPAATETRWQVDDAILCVRADLDLPIDYRLDANENPCGSRAWKSWRATAPEQVLRLTGPVTVTLQMLPDGGLAMSVRSSDASAGGYSVTGLVEDADIGAAANLIWPTIPDRTLTFPFSGATTVGRAVSWSANRMLRSGKVVVYTADESADRRSQVDEAELMLGDQVRLEAPEPGRAWPKGFVRVDGGAEGMHVVAFGRANSLFIERFGESGYDFRPGPIRKLAADPAIAFWGSVLAAYMTLVLSLQPFVSDEDADAGPATDLLSRFNRWMRKKRNRS